MITANVLAFLASPTSLVFSLVLSGIILAYDKKAKWTVLGPFTMGLARFSNVFLGASAAIGARLSQPASASDAYLTTLFPATAVFCYVYSITLLSRHEAEAPIDRPNSISTSKVQRIAFLIIGMDVAAMGVFFAAIGKPLALFITGILAFIVWYAWHASRKQPPGEAPRGRGIQQAIKALVLSIIVIDSAFIAAYAGIFYGLAALLLLPAPIALSKKLYVT
jgi:4-hydroxybenzoate polyprenyltransferase